MKVVRLAFNLYCNTTPSVDDYKEQEEQMDECMKYTMDEISVVEAIEAGVKTNEVCNS